jgi:hypothetical protein
MKGISFKKLYEIISLTYGFVSILLFMFILIEVPVCLYEKSKFIFYFELIIAYCCLPYYLSKFWDCIVPQRKWEEY